MSLLVLTGCQPEYPTQISAEFGKPGVDCSVPDPHPSCKDDDDSGGADPDQFELTMSGALEAGPVATTMDKETKRRMDLNIPAVKIRVYRTHAAAIDELTNPANPICEYRPDTMTLAQKESLAEGLKASRGAGLLIVDKRQDLGTVAYNQSDDGLLWTTWGFNTQTDGQQAADVTYDGTDKQDASATRHFRYNGGIVRVVMESVGDIVCNVQDEMLAVVSPASP